MAAYSGFNEPPTRIWPLRIFSWHLRHCAEENEWEMSGMEAP